MKEVLTNIQDHGDSVAVFALQFTSLVLVYLGDHSTVQELDVLGVFTLNTEEGGATWVDSIHNADWEPNPIPFTSADAAVPTKCAPPPAVGLQ